MEKIKEFEKNDVEKGKYIDLNDFTPLERDIILDFEQLDDEEKNYILILAAQLVVSHNQNTNEKGGGHVEQ